MRYRFSFAALLLLATAPAWANLPLAADPEQPTLPLNPPSPLADYRRYREAPSNTWTAAHRALSAASAGASHLIHTGSPNSERNTVHHLGGDGHPDATHHHAHHH